MTPLLPSGTLRPLGALAGILLVGILLGSCSKQQAARAPRANTATKAGLYHDFGILELGESRTHDFVIPIPASAPGSQVAPDAYQGNCACASGMLMIRKPSGSSKAIFGLPFEERTLEPGDEVVLRLMLKTAHKEPVDLARSEEIGYVGFKMIHGEHLRHSTERVRFHFGIRTPIRCTPVAHVTFGELPMSSKPYEQRIALTSNIPGRKLKLGKPVSAPACVATELAETADGYELLVRITPYRDFTTAPTIEGAVAIPTGQEHYPNLVIKVSGKFIGNIQFEPDYTIGLGLFPFDLPIPRQKPHPVPRKFVNLIDHDLSRPKEFVVHSFENANGLDISEHFKVSFQSLTGRKTRVYVDYLGTLGGKSLRAWLNLSKRAGEPPVARIRIVGYNSNAQPNSK